MDWNNNMQIFNRYQTIDVIYIRIVTNLANIIGNKKYEKFYEAIDHYLILGKVTAKFLCHCRLYVVY